MADPLADPVDLARLGPAGLEEVVAAAAATVRVDRKYVVPVAEARRLVADLADLADPVRVLTIEGRRWTSYRSTYFDTPSLAACRAHVQGRRRRWKLRSRLYVEDGFCRLEVKVRDGSGLTTKRFHPVDASDYGRLTGPGRAFAREELGVRGFGDVGAVTSTLEVTYRRATLAHLARGERVTLDTAVRSERGGRVVRLDAGHVVVETKGGPRPGAADRLLLAAGHRPRSFSKYAAGITLTDPRIADNDVRAMVGRELHVEDAPGPTSLIETLQHLESA